MAIANIAKSDNLIFMKEITATEASRNFAAVLDAVQAGEEIVITRGQVPIARLVKEEQANGHLLIKALEGWNGLVSSSPGSEEDMDWILGTRDADRGAWQDPWQQ
jgi:prevent-host-death family protein